jgi:predicted metal-dependent hydrolase
VTFWQKENSFLTNPGYSAFVTGKPDQDDSGETSFEKGRQHFDRGEYFEAHEVWEDLWNEASGSRHAFLQGVIQVAVALHHAGNRNWAGTRKLFASALGYLEKGRTESQPVDVERLRDRVLDFVIALQKRESGEEVALPFFSLPMLGDPA